MDIDEGKARLKKPNLAEIMERLPYKRMAERFTDYEGVMSDPNLTLTIKKIIKLQEVIEDMTGKKIHFASLQEKLLESCFCESKGAYKRTLEQVKINP